MNTQINAKDYVAPGTKLHTVVGWTLFAVLAPLVFLFLVLVSYGIVLIGAIVAGLTYFSRMKQMKAKLRGSALLVNEYQFPEIYQTASAMAARLGMSECPEIYIVEDNQQNAFAIKQGSNSYVVLVDDIVYGVTASGNSRALDFIIGHELAHHALGHTSFIRSLIRSKYKPLSRVDELSCDSVAHALVGDKAAARDALALLLVGPQLFSRVNKEALERQAREVVEDKHTKKAERNLSHPLLLRRYARLEEIVGS